MVDHAGEQAMRGWWDSWLLAWEEIGIRRLFEYCYREKLWWDAWLLLWEELGLEFWDAACNDTLDDV